jgi:hypothetical protein
MDWTFAYVLAAGTLERRHPVAVVNSINFQILFA